MKKNLKVYNISLLDCQVNLVLKSLQVYCYDVNEKYSRRKISITNEEASEKALIRDTYHQILSEYNEAKQASQ